MKQKYLTILLSVLMSMVGAETFASIAVENADGVTIYYTFGGIGNRPRIRTPQYGMEAIYNNSANDGIPVVTVTSRVQHGIEFSPRHRSSSGDEDGYDYVGRVVIPETVIIEGITYAVKYIDDWAFEGCAELTEIVIPCSIDSIGVDAFKGCSGLEKIVVASDNPKYDSREDCNALIRTDSNELIAGCKNTHIPNGVTAISSSAFYGCTGLTGELILPNSVNDIGASAFEECSGLTGLTIGKGVVSIGKHAFLGCSSLEKIVVDADNRYYDSREDCNAIIRTYGTEQILIAGCKNSHIPNGVTAIDEHAFYGMAGLTKIHIPNSVTSIDNYAFDDCSNLTEVTIGNSVTSIGYGAFIRCESLVSVTSLNPVPPTIYYDTFEQITKETATLHVPEGCKRTYWTLPYWEQFVNIQDDATDGIESVFTDKQGRTAIYTLDGKRLSTTNAADLPKGIYIVNGKKVVVK